MKLRSRHRALFEHLSRPRLGLTEREVQAIQRPHTGLLVLAAATGLAPVPNKGARSTVNARARDPQGANPCEQR